MTIKTAAATLVGSLFLAAAVHATPVNSTSTDTSCGATSPNCDLQSLLNAWTQPGSTAPNVQSGQYSPDGRWVMGSTDRSNGILVFEVAGNATGNRFGIYDVLDPSKRLQLFDGPQGSYAKVTVDLTGNTFSILGGPDSVVFGSDVFGFYLTGPSGLTFFSESALNDGVDHMVAFNGNNQQMKWPYDASKARKWLPNELLLAWEDLPDADGDGKPGDWDYNDMLVIMESVSSVPVPGPLALLGVGLLSLGLARRRA